MNFEDWELVCLEEVAEELTVGFVGSMASEYVEQGIPFFRSLNIEPFRINKQDLKYISKEFHAKLKKSSLHPGDVVIVRTGKPGACLVVPEWVTEANCSDLVIIRPGKKIDSHYLSYYVNSVATGHVNAHLVGAVQQHFNVSSARSMKIMLPSIEEQKAITSILNAINDKIEINNRINKTLEEMAQALFKQWFVDFEFPDENGQPYKSSGGEMEESELGPIPKGWKVKQLDEVVTLSNKTINPQNHNSKLFEHFSIPSFDDKKAPILEIGQNIKSNKFVINSSNILVSKLNPSTKRIWKPLCSTANAVCSTEFMVYNAMVEKHTDYYYSLMDSVEFQNFLLAHVTGSTNSRQRVTPSSTLQYKYVSPSDPILEMYVEIAKPVFAKVQINTIENCRLMKLRDTLLPKLMSGEIRVPIEEVTADV